MYHGEKIFLGHNFAARHSLPANDIIAVLVIRVCYSYSVIGRWPTCKTWLKLEILFYINKRIHLGVPACLNKVCYDTIRQRTVLKYSGQMVIAPGGCHSDRRCRDSSHAHCICHVISCCDMHTDDSETVTDTTLGDDRGTSCGCCSLLMPNKAHSVAVDTRSYFWVISRRIAQ